LSVVRFKGLNQFYLISPFTDFGETKYMSVTGWK